MIIGQNRLLEQIYNLIPKFPRFVILIGAKGSGKKTIANEIARQMRADIIQVEKKAAEIKEALQIAYTKTSSTIFLLTDIDRMSIQAKNALLKVTEEPPKKAYFILTVENESTVLDTLISRGHTLYLDSYSNENLLSYISNKGYKLNEEELKIALNICSVPGEIDLLMNYTILEFNDFVLTVIQNLHKASAANALKIGNRLAFKDGDQGYPPTLFLKFIIYNYLQEMKQENKPFPLETYCKLSMMTNESIQQFLNPSFQKLAIMDDWIMQARQILWEVK